MPTGNIISSEIFSEPVVLNKSVYPEKVKHGDVLLTNLVIEDEYGIESVTGEIEGIDNLSFYLTEGALKNGTWENAWIVHTTENMKWYNTNITIKNIKGETTATSVRWQDPTVYHHASEVLAGTFDAGDFTFQDNLVVQDNVIVQDNLTVQKNLSVGIYASIKGNLTVEGNVGIGTTTPRTSLDVQGAIGIGNTTLTCNSTNAGILKWNSSSKSLEICDADEWRFLYGLSCACTGTGYKMYIYNGDKVYVDCNTDKCWTPASDSIYTWGGRGTNEPTDSCVGIADRPACNYCDNLDYGGFTDWVLPDSTTLQNLCNSAFCPSTCFGGDGSTDSYWSSTEFSGNEGAYAAYYVNFGTCGLPGYGDIKLSTYYVRCVRG